MGQWNTRHSRKILTRKQGTGRVGGRFKRGGRDDERRDAFCKISCPSLWSFVFGKRNGTSWKKKKLWLGYIDSSGLANLFHIPSCVRYKMGQLVPILNAVQNSPTRLPLFNLWPLASVWWFSANPQKSADSPKQKKDVCHLPLKSSFLTYM